MRRKAAQSRRIAGCDHRTTGQIGVRNEKCVDSEFGSGADRAQQLPRSNRGPCVDRVHLGALTTRGCEDARVGSSTANHFGEYRCHGCDGQVSCAHLYDQGYHPISSVIGPVHQRRNGLAVKQQHSGDLG